MDCDAGWEIWAVWISLALIAYLVMTRVIRRIGLRKDMNGSIDDDLARLKKINDESAE